MGRMSDPFPNSTHAPTSTSLGLFMAEVTDLAREAMAWVGGARWRPLSFDGTTMHHLYDALPLTNRGGIGREIYVPVGNGWVCYFNNSVGGTDTSSVLGYMARQLGCRTIRCVVAEKPSSRWPAVIIEVFNGSFDWERSIAAMNDGGRWRFDLDGTPYPFEELERYEAKRKADRFKPDMLQRYLRGLGVPPLIESNFQFDSAVLLENTRMPEKDRTRISYDPPEPWDTGPH